MSGDLSVTSASLVQTAPVRASTPGTLTASTSGTTTATQSAALAGKGPPPVNPGLYLDPSTNLVVLQFFDAQGQVTQSAPSQKQLDAYKRDGVLPGHAPTSIS